MAAQPNPRELLASSFDRIREASFYITQMEHTYHFADPFRWSLCGFLRALKEIPQIIKMELQNRDGFKAWFEPRHEAVRAEVLIDYLGKQRDVVVHRQMLKPASWVTIGVTEGRGPKLGIHFEFNPLEDSDQAMERYLNAVAAEEGILADILGVLADDEESLPCVIREWKLDKFPDHELTALAREAWVHMAKLLNDTFVWLGGEPFPVNTPPTQHDRVSIRTYERKDLLEWLSEIKSKRTSASPKQEGQPRGAAKGKGAAPPKKKPNTKPAPRKRKLNPASLRREKSRVSRKKR